MTQGVYARACAGMGGQVFATRIEATVRKIIVKIKIKLKINKNNERLESLSTTMASEFANHRADTNSNKMKRSEIKVTFSVERSPSPHPRTCPFEFEASRAGPEPVHSGALLSAPNSNLLELLLIFVV